MTNLHSIAVTGATGGLGRSLVEGLLASGHSVVALGRNVRIGAELESCGAKFIAGSITDSNYLSQAFSGVEVVVHCAGLASPWGDWEDFFTTNVKGTESVLKAMKERGVTRLIHISTPSVYFSGKSRTDIKEDDEIPIATNFYAKSKLQADDLVLEASKQNHLKSVLIRPRAIFGKYDATILPRMLKVLNKGYFPLFDGGEALVDLTAVENVIHAIQLALEKIDRFEGEIFNISNAEPMKIRELLYWLKQELGLKTKFFSVPSGPLKIVADILEIYADKISHREPILSRYSIETMGTTQTLNIDKAKNLLGYRPIISVRDALKKTLQEIRKK